MPRNPIRVMIVDDHDMVRRGLAVFLRGSGDLKLVGEAGSGREALSVCEEVQPEVILMDLVMPEMDGAEAIRHIHKNHPEMKIIALTNFKEPELVENALQAGAISYLLKNVTAETLAQAIRSALKGKSVLAPEATQVLIQSALQADTRGKDLTDRELEVLRLMVEGLTNPQIAARLSVSRSTARAHVSQILSKLGASNRAEAVSLAFRLKLVS